MPSLPPDRDFLRAAALGMVLTLATWLLATAGAGGGDAGPLLLSALVAGIALTMFSLVPPAVRLLFRGWRNVGIGPRDAAVTAQMVATLSIAVWLLWAIGAALALPNAWAPMLAYLEAP